MALAPEISTTEYHRLLVEHSPDFLSRHSLGGVVLYASSACLRLLGYAPAELTGRSLFEFMHAGDAELVRRAWNNPQARLEKQMIDCRMRVKEGRFVWFRMLYQVIDDKAGAQVLCSSRNITDLKHIEVALQILAHDNQSLSNDETFRPLVSHVTAALRVKFAFITESSADKSRVRMLAFWNGDDYGVPYEYDLQGTPCDQVINKGEVCHYPLGVQALFPNDQDLVGLNAQGYLGIPVTDSHGVVIGHLAILDDKPVRLDDMGMAILKLFAARAGAGLERIQRAQAQ